MNAHRPAADHLASIEACEQRLVNVWPAVDTVLLGRWVLRFANGYSGRANSASPLWRGADLSDDELALVVHLYRQAGLPPAIRVTPLADERVAAQLAAQGWGARTSATGMVADAAPGWRGDGRVTFAPVPARDWLNGVSALQELSKRDPAHLAAIVGRIRLPVGFATLHVDGAAVGFGMVGVDRGWAEIGSIILAPEVRGKGLGRALVASLLAHAVGLGAARAFLQVEAGNMAAITLYRSLGFDGLYDYCEWRLPG